MHLDSIQKQILRVMLVTLFATVASPLLAQVAPSARERGFPLAVGVGLSDFDLDWGKEDNGNQRRMEGISAWIDFTVPHTPKTLRGLGLEIEGHDINFGRPADIPTMRQDTALGGAIYTWRHYRNFHPYAKYLIGIGSIDFPPLPASPAWYRHDTRTVYAPGAGLEYRAYRSLWVRGDYEYQYWPKIFGPHTLNPNGYTVGVAYDFRRLEHR
jgi:opacity protein-like surface antigen